MSTEKPARVFQVDIGDAETEEDEISLRKSARMAHSIIQGAMDSEVSPAEAVLAVAIVEAYCSAMHADTLVEAKDKLNSIKRVAFQILKRNFANFRYPEDDINS